MIVAAVLFSSGCLFGGSGGIGPLDGDIASSDAEGGGPADVSGLRDSGSDAPDAPNAPNAPDASDAPDAPDDECGNGLLEAGETCDPGLPSSSPGACPDSCDDDVACTRGELLGSAETCDAVCLFTAITECIDGDGCCPSGCGPDVDDDCVVRPVCGDGQVTEPELCDSAIGSDLPGSCPVSAEDCEERICKNARVIGAAQDCDAECVYDDEERCVDGDGCCPAGCDATTDDDCEPVCGNGVTEPGETCDGDCPTDCDDGNACTRDVMEGSPANCDVECVHDAITACVDGDGCCAPGCNANNDDDCNATCGNGIVEGGETCDGDCPADCDDFDPCTLDTSTGSAANCDFLCSHSLITSCVDGDGCCPDSCTASNDADCSPTCVLGGDCSCASQDICEGGLCANDPSGGYDCTSACDPTAYCQFYWGWPACSANGECAECGQDPDCGTGAPYCVDGWCTECISNADCGAAEWCDSGFCSDPGDCLRANDPDAWCETYEPVVGSTVVCIDQGFAIGSCFVACPTQEVCDCPNWYDRCVADTDGTLFCEPFSERCEEACLPDQWCRNSYGSGNYLCADPNRPDGCCPSADNTNCD